MKDNFLIKLTIYIVIANALTLPFHWVWSEKIVVPKKNITYDKTFISEEDVREIVRKYYLGSLMEKLEVEGAPLTEALIKRWEVYEENGDTNYIHLVN